MFDISLKVLNATIQPYLDLLSACQASGWSFHGKTVEPEHEVTLSLLYLILLR